MGANSVDLDMYIYKICGKLLTLYEEAVKCGFSDFNRGEVALGFYRKQFEGGI